MTFWIVFSVMFFMLAAVLYIYCTRNTFNTLDGFITARNTLSTGPAVATIFASIMGAWILFSPAEAGTWGGLTAFMGYAVAQALVVVAFAIFGPRLRYLAPNCSTLPEFVFYRYGRGMYILTLIVSMFYMAVFLAAELTGIALAVYLVTGIPLWITALLIGGSTLVYTTYGGIRGSIFTDTIQGILIIPLLLLAFFGTLSSLGGFGEAVARVKSLEPSLLSFKHVGAWEFTATLLIAVFAANMFHQGLWSRVYASRDAATVRKAFIIAGLMIIPVVMIAGSFGLMAVAENTLTSPSSALFEVVLASTPTWVITVVLVLAVALVMSSADTLINAMTGIITVDIARARKDISPKKLIAYSRFITAIICILVITIASQGYSVLYLFFIADLVCAAALFPVFFGLYSERFPGWAGLVATLCGVLAGALLFPDPAFTRGNLLHAFSLALFIPIVISLILGSFASKTVDLASLQDKVHDAVK